MGCCPHPTVSLGMLTLADSRSRTKEMEIMIHRVATMPQPRKSALLMTLLSSLLPSLLLPPPPLLLLPLPLPLPPPPQWKMRWSPSGHPR